MKKSHHLTPEERKKVVNIILKMMIGSLIIDAVEDGQTVIVDIGSDKKNESPNHPNH